MKKRYIIIAIIIIVSIGSYFAWDQYTSREKTFREVMLDSDFARALCIIRLHSIHREWDKGLYDAYSDSADVKLCEAAYIEETGRLIARDLYRKFN